MSVGLGVGVVGSLLLARLMQGLLFGVQPNDPMTLPASPRPWRRSA